MVAEEEKVQEEEDEAESIVAHVLGSTLFILRIRVFVAKTPTSFNNFT